jgi:hypothetical protein
MDLLREMTYDECRERLLRGSVGRVALCTPSGPQIVPVNYVVDGQSIVFQTAPYTVLGTHGRGAQIAFEVDHTDDEDRSGWSVVAVGRCAAVESPVDVARYRTYGGPRPWAAGSRPLHLKLTWSGLTGRQVGRQDARPDGARRAP